MRRGDDEDEAWRCHDRITSRYVGGICLVAGCSQNDGWRAGPNAAGTAKIDAAVRIYLVRRGDDEDEASVYRAGKTVCISRRQDWDPHACREPFTALIHGASLPEV